MATRRRARGAGPAEIDEATRARALLVHDRLCAEYGCPIAFFHELDPVSELVSSLLSHRTKNRDSGRAFRQLRAAFPTWAGVRDAPTPAVEDAIAPATWPEQKAPRIQQVLRAVGERAGHLDDHALDFLANLPVPEARAWLEALPGVGPKTSAAVLLFSRLRRPALPVDSHHHRVAQRLGLIGDDVEVGPSHAVLEAQLPPGWSAQQVYDNHEALMLHGQRCCYWRDPACGRCVVLDLCPTGQQRLGRDARAPGHRSERAVAPPVAVAADQAVVPEEEERPLPPLRRPHAAAPARRANGARRLADRPEEHTMADQQNESRGLPGEGDPNHDARVHTARNQDQQELANDPQHYRQEHEDRAHGTHGKGFSDETRVDDDPVTTGDRDTLRQAQDPESFKRTATKGNMGGAGWGNEAAGGSSIDKRPPG